MSMFGFHFVTGLLQEVGWPRRKGLFNGTAVIDTTILDSAIDQMVDWAAALGAGRPTLALQIVAEAFRDREMQNFERRGIKILIEGGRTENERWRVTEAIAPHDIARPIEFRFADNGPTIDVRGFKENRLSLELWFLEGLLWGIDNPRAFETWYQLHYEEQIKMLPLMRKAGVAVVEPLDLPHFLADSEEILRNYEREFGPLPAVPESLLADARALGVRL